MIDVKETLAQAEERMEEAVMYLEEALAHIRAGKANIRILVGIKVDSYGSMVPLNNVAAIVFDYRGYDTMGESFILLTAIAGSYIILKNMKGRKEELDDEE